MGKLLFFIIYFLESSKLPNLITLGETPSSLGLYARYQGLIELLSIFLWLRRATSIAAPMFLRTWEKRSIPSDHAAVRVVIQRPTVRGHQGKRIPSWMSEHPVFCFILKRLHDDHRYSADPFGALAEFKAVLAKAKMQSVRELSRKTPDSIGAKLLTASTALRAYRNRHLGTLMPCCEAWDPVGKCFDPTSFECVDFQKLSQMIASLTRENLAE